MKWGKSALNCVFLRLACTCEETGESVWPPNLSLYASSTCVHLRLLADPFGQGLRHVFVLIYSRESSHDKTRRIMLLEDPQVSCKFTQGHSVVIKSSSVKYCGNITVEKMLSTFRIVSNLFRNLGKLFLKCFGSLLQLRVERFASNQWNIFSTTEKPRNFFLLRTNPYSYSYLYPWNKPLRGILTPAYKIYTFKLKKTQK